MMNHTAQMFEPQNYIERKLADFWDMIDISENMGRIEQYTETISNGVASRIHMFVFFILTLCGLVVTWHFDLESTIIGMNSFTTKVIPSLPAQAVAYSAWIVVAFTLMPTLLEVFTAGLAKFDVKIIQILIIGMTLFDLLTDMPRAYDFAMGFWPQIQQIPLISGIIFWIVYVVFQLLATIGFEMATIVFAYATIIFLAKSSKSVGSSTQVHSRRPYNARSRRQPTRNVQPVDFAYTGSSSGFNAPSDSEQVVIIE